MLVCVFCENTYEEGTVLCPECTDYKGMMPLAEATQVYDFLDYLKEVN